MMFKYKKSVPFAERKAAAQKIRTKHPDAIPIILERVSGSQLKNVQKNKFLVRGDATMGHFYLFIRGRINLTPERALFCFVNNTIPPASATMMEIFKQHHDEDMFLYVAYTDENVFGN